jgi:hypothetical protein
MPDGKRVNAMTRIYAGIGSRETPEEVLDLMEKAAFALAKKGWILRSGGADGADSAFERGCVRAGGAREIYLPWKGFNGNPSALFSIPGRAVEIASRYHPAWGVLKRGAQALHSRNVLQVLGADCETPAAFILCWARVDSNGRTQGGTGQAVRIAEAMGIPVVNLAVTPAPTLKDLGPLLTEALRPKPDPQR